MRGFFGGTILFVALAIGFDSLLVDCNVRTALGTQLGQEVLLDAPPKVGQKDYSPAEGQQVETTPPPFIWVPVKQQSSYVLQISASESFSPETTQTFGSLQRSVFVPRQPLPPGKWFWRYGIETDRGVVFSKARTFTIPPDARPFPFPDWDKVISRIPHIRPRLFFPSKRLEEVRALARGELKPAIDRLVAVCEQEIATELVAEPGNPPRGPEIGPWAVNVMWSTRPPMNVMEQCALAYLLTGDKRLGQEARRRLLHFFSWNPEGPTSFFVYDEPTMWMMMRGVRAYDWTYELFAPEERERIEANMKARAQQFLKRLESMPFESNPYDSHAGRLPGFLGECALSFIHEWPEARQWLDYATLLYYTSYPAWGGDDGGWHEGPSYWGAYMEFALHFVIALREAAGVNLMQKPFFRNTPYYALYAATPYHQHCAFGDGKTFSPKELSLGKVMYAFSSLNQDPYARWYAEEAGFKVGSDLISLATYDSSLKARAPLELPPARSFPSVGLVAFHTALGDKKRDISFLLRSSPYGGFSHGHADQNAFVIEAFGRGLAISTGYYPWYGSPHHYQWTRATRAANSILVGGKGQAAVFGAGGRLVAFDSVEGYDYAETEAAPAYEGRLERFRRHLVHVRPGIFVMYDDLRAPQPSRFQWLLHAYNQIAIDEARQILRVENSLAAMSVHLLLPERLEFSQNDKYDPEPELVGRKHETISGYQKTWHLTAATPEPQATSQFLSVMLVYRVGQEHSLPKVALLRGQGAVGLRLSASDGTEDVVAFRTDYEVPVVSCGGIESSARVFAQGMDKDGNPLRRFSSPGE